MDDTWNINWVTLREGQLLGLAEHFKSHVGGPGFLAKKYLKSTQISFI